MDSCRAECKKVNNVKCHIKTEENSVKDDTEKRKAADGKASHE